MNLPHQQQEHIQSISLKSASPIACVSPLQEEEVDGELGEPEEIQEPAAMEVQSSKIEVEDNNDFEMVRDSAGESREEIIEV